MGKTKIGRWTRDGVLDFEWSQFESFEKLVMTPSVQSKLIEKVEYFVQGEGQFHSMLLPWRFGIFFFGPSGCGKTAAGRAIARLLDWDHLTIPAYQILDAHLFERALSDALTRPKRVIVLEDIDLMIRNMETEVFFTLLDSAFERAEGTFWIANSRHPEQAPKTQLIRPGRFDEAIRLEPPTLELRQTSLKQLFNKVEMEIEESSFSEVLEQTHGLTFSHFEELRQILSRMVLEKRDRSEFMPVITSYLEDQMIAGDRWGGLSDQTEILEERVKHMDPRVLSAAVEMTDVFRQLMEKVIGDAAEKSKTEEADMGT